MLIKKGAEADLFLAEWQNRKVIMKQRVPKKYRIPEIDHQIRYHRTIHESQMIHQAKKAGTLTPTIFMIDLVETTIIMDADLTFILLLPPWKKLASRPSRNWQRHYKVETSR